KTPLPFRGERRGLEAHQAVGRDLSKPPARPRDRQIALVNRPISAQSVEYPDNFLQRILQQRLLHVPFIADLQEVEVLLCPALGPVLSEPTRLTTASCKVIRRAAMLLSLV